jgi:alkylation response protein AidB-like acyl-CoA dehydrogenase
MSTLSPAPYEIPPEFEDFRATIAQIVRERVAPRASAIDASAEYPLDIRELFADHDLFALPFDEEYGGTGTGHLMQVIAIEEVAKACAASALMLAVHDLGSLPIRLRGSEEMKDRVLPRLASGEWVPAFALSEPAAGSDPGGMKTRAVTDEDGWVLNGSKNWISQAGVADVYVVFAVTDPEQGHSRGITAFLLERDLPGFSIGKPEHKLGIKGSPTASLTFDDVHLPPESVIGEQGRGFQLAMETLDRSRLGIAAQALGTHRAQLTTRSRMRVSAGSSAIRSPASRGSSSSWPTWRRGRQLRASCCTKPQPRPTAKTPTLGSTRRWRSSSARTRRWPSRSRPYRYSEATATSATTR